MKTIRIIVMLLAALYVCPSRALADGTLEVNSDGGGFCLFAKGKAAVINVDPAEPVVVKKAAQLFTEDMKRVTGTLPPSKGGKGTSVIVATLGHNKRVDGLVASGKLDIADIRGGWERFVIRTVGNELFIVGSDRRGAAYGVLTLSEKIGVSPWYWWADAPVTHRDALYVKADYVSKEPSVRYRGIFINDEDWGLKPWASKTYEKELGDIGPRTYARVCELLLRLKANMLAPAMHSCTGAFYSHPESKVVADSFAIVITTSHCEPLLLNNAAKTEWDQQRDGDWNYKTNRDVIYKKWDDRLAEAGKYENIYTVAMRGVHDSGLRGNLPMNERVPLIEKVIADQRELLAKHVAPLSPPEGGTIDSPSKVKTIEAPSGAVGGAGASSIPQIFVPYKETMDIYENGLRVPEDITLVWVDDNYGYMKRVANPEEQKRSGHSGVYYHISYLGAPHDYLWIHSTPPMLMYEELKKAYDTGADRYWLLNVGDIKPMELGIQTFMEMAWDLPAFSIENVNNHQARFLDRLLCGSESGANSAAYQTILDTYYRLAWSRKPEYMGWEYEWDDEAHTGLKPTEFSFKNYDEAQQRLADYKRISDMVEKLAPSEGASDAFFQLLQFPIQAAYQMNRKFLMAQLNQELIADARVAEANWAARQAQEAFDSINALNQRYNEQLDGKWRHFMTLPPGFRALYQRMPDVVYTEGAGEQTIDLTPQRPPMNTVSQGYLPINLAKCESKSDDTRIVDGLGYAWQVVQLGDPVAGLSAAAATVTYSTPAIAADSITVRFSTIPFWPLYKGKSNRVGVSIDGGEEQVFENRFKEYSREWKDQVMRNGALCRMTFAIDKSKKSHTVTFRGIDPGQMLQQATIDWGGLLPAYIGPAPLSPPEGGTIDGVSRVKTIEAPSGAVGGASPPSLEFIMQLRVTLGQTYTLGDTPHGRRTVIPITGGTFEGPRLRGTIIPGGADYQMATEGGRRTELEAIYSIKADDGTIIHVRNKGIIATPGEGKQGEFYFKAAPQFEAPLNSPLAWLNDAIYVCAPDFSQQFNGIVLNVWKVK